MDEKIYLFHKRIIKILDDNFPEKTIKISTLDKKWMSPQLKQLHRRVQCEIFKNRQSKKWRKLKRAFKKLKKISDFVNELKFSNPGKWPS